MYADISAQIGLLAEKNVNDIYCDTNRIILPEVRMQKTKKASSIVKKIGRIRNIVTQPRTPPIPPSASSVAGFQLS